MVVVFRPLVGKYLGRFAPTRVFLVGAVLSAAALVLGGVANLLAVWVVAMGLCGPG